MPVYNITADSTPDYDSWGPDDYWSCEDWITWHKALKAKYGKAEADSKWLAAWNAQDSFEHNYNWCKYAAAFNTYVSTEKLAASHLLADIFSGVTKIGENAVDTATSTSKILKYLIPTVIVIIVIGAIIYFGKRYKVFG